MNDEIPRKQVPTEAVAQIIEQRLTGGGSAAGDYFNGFEIGIGPSDIVITLTRNNQRRGTFNCTTTIAKSFAAALTKTVEVVEDATGQKALTLEDFIRIQAKIVELQKERFGKNG